MTKKRGLIAATKKFVILLLMLLASACVQKPSFKGGIVEQRALPTVSIMPRVRKNELVCSLQEEPYCDLIQEKFLTTTVEVLSAYGKFKEVSLGDHQADLTIYLSQNIEDESEGNGGLVRGMFEFLFLYMLPVKYKYTYKINFEVYRGENLLGSFKYNEFWFFNRSNEAQANNLAKQNEVTKAFAIKFLNDFQTL